MGQAIPDLTWNVEDLHVLGDMIIVRGRAQGTPTGEFWGARPTGKSFDTMAIDLFTVRGDKLANCFHIENWMTALDQLKAE
jgi:predicted ester cyclase